jgi:hypothetical protein
VKDLVCADLLERILDLFEDSFRRLKEILRNLRKYIYIK